MTTVVLSLGQLISSDIEKLKKAFETKINDASISGDEVWQWIKGFLPQLRLAQIDMAELCARFNNNFHKSMSLFDFEVCFNSMSTINEESLLQVTKLKKFLENNLELKLLVISHTNLTHLDYILSQLETVLPSIRLGVVSDENEEAHEAQIIFATSMYSQQQSHTQTLRWAINKLCINADTPVVSFLNTIQKTEQFTDFHYIRSDLMLTASDIMNHFTILQYPHLNIIETTNRVDIIHKLSSICPTGAHFTNGTYAFDASLIVPTTLAGFKYITDTQTARVPLVVAINSDESMRRLNKTGYQSQSERAMKVAIPMAKLFSERNIVVIFYDEKTPLELYQALSRYNLNRTLHKWGYGTKQEEPKIEGAECFDMVYGFPLPNDMKPLCYAETPCSDAPQNVTACDLRGSYINEENELLFDLPKSLSTYQSKEELASYSVTL